MLIRTILHGAPISVSLTDRAVTLGRNDEFIAAWDLAGRLYSVVDAGRTYRRGLNGRMLVKWRDDGARQRQWANDADANAVVDRAAAFAEAVSRQAAVSISVVRDDRAGNELREVLGRAAAFDSRSASADAARFARTWQPIGILPPDQYLALVLQATEGCSFRSCTFCEFYREPYRVRDAGQFADHVVAALDYLGDSIRLRGRSIFLGSANALAVPMSGLLPIFDVLTGRFSGRPVHAFLDGFTGTMKSAADYRMLAERGLRRVYVGLESGHDPLLAFVDKPSTRGQAVETVRAIKAGGASVGVIVMVGLGGDRFADAHVADTAEAINAMPLGEGDLLYFSELVDLPGSPYAAVARKAGIHPLTAEERVRQRREIEKRLRFAAPPKIAVYDVREFVY